MKIADIIKYEGDNDTFVWKHPIEDFNTTTQLIVHDSQEAIFFRDGQALDLFGAGRHTLSTQNLPLLNKIVNIPTDGKTPFHCEVYFINKTMPLDMKWGTNSKVQVLDPKFNILLHAGASGGMGVQIEDSRKFLMKFVGTKNSFDKQTLIEYFRELIITRTKTYLNKIMSQVSFVTVNSKLDEISAAMHEMLANDIKPFGVKLINFFVSTIQLDKDDYEKIQTALADAGAVGIAATAEKGRMETLGYNWADKEMAEIMKTYAANEGMSNDVGGIMAQMPMAFAFGQMIKDNTQNGFGSMAQAFSGKVPNAAGAKFCSNCGKHLEADAKFCSSCGKALGSTNACVNCGKVLKDGENFCSNCGTKREG